MPKYRLIKNGYVNSGASDQELILNFRNLQLLRKDGYNDFDQIIKGYVAIETFRIANSLTGGNFAAFLEFNFQGGRGPLADIIRDISHYLNGNQGHLAIQTGIRIAEHVLESVDPHRAATYTNTLKGPGTEAFPKDGYTIVDYDLYRLAAGIGPALLGRFFLLLGGELYYAN